MSFFPGSMSNFVPIDGEGRQLTSTQMDNGAVSGDSGDAASQPAMTSTAGTPSDTVSPTRQLRWITSRVPASSTTPQRGQVDTSRAQTTKAQEGLVQQITQHFHSHSSRIENLERGNSESFGDVKKSLRSMETFRQHLSNMFNDLKQEQSSELHCARRDIAAWHDGLKDEVGKLCSEQTSKLVEAGDEIFARLTALEQGGSPAPSEAINKRLSETEERISTFQQAMQILDANTQNSLDHADGECQRRCDDTNRACDKISNRLSKLEKAAEATLTQKHSNADRLTALENALKQLQDDAQTRANDDIAASSSSDRRIDELEKTVEGLTRRNSNVHERVNKADTRFLESMRRIDDLARRMETHSAPVHPQPSNEAHAPAIVAPTLHSNEPSEHKIDALARRVEEYDKAIHKRFDFLIKQLPGIRDQDQVALQRVLKTIQPPIQPAANIEDAVARAFAAFEQRIASEEMSRPATSDYFKWPTMVRIQQLEDSVKELGDNGALLSIEERLEEMVKNSTEASLQERLDDMSRCRDDKMTDLGKRIEKMEKDHAAHVAVALDEVRTRLTHVEKVSTGAALEARFVSFAEQVATLNEKCASMDNRDGLRALAERVTKVEHSRQRNKAGTDDTRAACHKQHEDFKKRIENVEDHARTSAGYYNASQAESVELGRRIRALEEKGGDQSVDVAESDALGERVAKVESLVSEDSLRRRIDEPVLQSLKVLTTAFATVEKLEGKMEASHTLCRETSQGVDQRLAALEKIEVPAQFQRLEGKMKALHASCRETSQGAEKRLAALEKSEVAAAVDRRFESFSDELTKVRELVAAEQSEREIAVLSEMVAQAENSIANVREHVSESNPRELLDRVGRVEKGLSNIEVARNTKDDRLTEKVDMMASRLDENAKAQAGLSRDAACLTVAHAELKEEVVDLKDTMDATRRWLDTVSGKSQSDDQAILNESRGHHSQHDLRVGFAEERLGRLQDDLRALQTAKQAAKPEREDNLADDIRRLRHRLEESEPDENAQRQASDLVRSMHDGSFFSSRGPLKSRVQEGPASRWDEGSRSFSNPNVERSPAVDARSKSSLGARTTTSGMGAASREATRQRSPTTPLQPANKRRRLNMTGEREDSLRADVRQSRQIATPDDEGSEEGGDDHDEEEEAEEDEPTPRRSDRKGKGQNALLENMPGMLTGIRWKNSMMKKPRRMP